MKKQTFRISVTLCLFFIMAAALVSTQYIGKANAQNGGSNRKTQITAQPLLAFSDGSVLPSGGTILVRTDKGVYMSIHAFGLTPGNAVSAWFVFFNEPKKCKTSPCTPADLSNPDVQPSLVNATGRIVGPDGTADFGAFRAIGDTTGAVSGPGLLDPKKAEIHLAVRSHGPAILDNLQTLKEQLSIFNGGCPPNTCATLQISIHQP
jgi:hypothetical protein